jgi:hypothetical protein
MSQFDELYLEGEPDFRVDARGVREIRKAITHGLYAVLEVEKMRVARESADDSGKPWPEEANAVLPAQSLVETLQPMAEALLWLEQAGHATAMVPPHGRE